MVLEFGGPSARLLSVAERSVLCSVAPELGASARQHGRMLAAREHHRENERGLDDGHGQGEDQRPEGLAYAMRHHFGVVDRREHRTDESDPAQHGKERAYAGRDCADE